MNHVVKNEHFFKNTIESRFFSKSSMGGNIQIFSRARMPATSICPQSGTVIFSIRPFLEHILSPFVFYMNGKSPVEDSFLVNFQFLQTADSDVVRINNSYFFVHYFDNFTMAKSQIYPYGKEKI